MCFWFLGIESMNVLQLQAVFASLIHKLHSASHTTFIYIDATKPANPITLGTITCWMFKPAMLHVLYAKRMILSKKHSNFVNSSKIPCYKSLLVQNLIAAFRGCSSIFTLHSLPSKPRDLDLLRARTLAAWWTDMISLWCMNPDEYSWNLNSESSWSSGYLCGSLLLYKTWQCMTAFVTFIYLNHVPQSRLGLLFCLVPFILCLLHLSQISKNKASWHIKVLASLVSLHSSLASHFL